MKKILAVIVVLVLFSGSSVSLLQNEAKAGTTYLKEIEATIVYGTTGEGGVEIAGVEVPVGLSGSFGTDPIGVLKNCSWAFATCDNSKVGFTPF